MSEKKARIVVIVIGIVALLCGIILNASFDTYSQRKSIYQQIIR